MGNLVRRSGRRDSQDHHTIAEHIRVETVLSDLESCAVPSRETDDVYYLEKRNPSVLSVQRTRAKLVSEEHVISTMIWPNRNSDARHRHGQVQQDRRNSKNSRTSTRTRTQSNAASVNGADTTRRIVGARETFSKVDSDEKSFYDVDAVMK